MQKLLFNLDIQVVDGAWKNIILG